jgi:transcriptional regulator with XRE-family HTH domain
MLYGMATQAAVVDTEWVPAFSFGDRMRLVRRKRGRSQEQMAALLDVKKVTYASWEAGRTPSLEEVQHIARRLYLIDRVPQWWTLGADVPPANLWDAGARSSTDRASDYGSLVGVFARSTTRRHGRRSSDRPRHLAIAV